MSTNSKKLTILLIEPRLVSQRTLISTLPEFDVIVAHDAESAVELAADTTPALVIMEMSLSGHSGMEFLYEFRTYPDWLKIPIIIYSSLKITDEILSSRAWEKLNINDYLYKPDSSLASLKNAVEKVMSTTLNEAVTH